MSEPAAEAQQANLWAEAELLSALCAQLAEAGNASVQSELAGWSALGNAAALLSEQFGKLAQGDVTVKIAVVGDFSAGKSSFINNLLEDEDLCPEHDDPTTSCVTSFAYAPKERIVRHEADGRQVKLSRDKYRKQVQNRRADGADVEVRRFTFFLPLPLLKGVELLDTPGFNNPRNSNDNEVTASIMAEADAFIYMVDVQTGTIAESGLARLRQIRSRANDAPIYVVLSKADQKPPVVLTRLKAALQDKHGDLFTGRIFCWSTRPVGARADLDAHSAMAALFTQMREFKLFVTRKTLALNMRRHRDQRIRVEVRIESQLQGLMRQQLQVAAGAEKSLQTISDFIEQLQNDLGPRYVAEVRRAWSASFIAREIKGTGVFFCDGGIFLSSTPLPSVLPTLGSSAELRERLLVDIPRHFRGRAAAVRAAISGMCKAALADTIASAQCALEKQFSLHAERRFDTDISARKALENVLKPIGAEVAAALWHEWLCWITGLLSLVSEEYVEPVVESAQTQAAYFHDMLVSYHALVAVGEPEPEFN